MTDLATIRAALAAATPGPWEADDDGVTTEAPGGGFAVGMAYHPPFGRPEFRANATLIAHAPAWLAELVERVERAEAEVDVEEERKERAQARAEAAEREVERLKALLASAVYERDALRSDRAALAAAAGEGSPWRCPCGEDCEIVDYPTGVRSCGNVTP